MSAGSSLRCGPQSARGYRAPPHGGHRRRSTARKPGQPLQAPARGRQRGSARLQARVAASGLPETLGPKLVPLVQPRGSRRAARAQRRRRLRLPRRSRGPRSGVAESSRDPDSRLRLKPGGSPGVHRAWAHSLAPLDPSVPTCAPSATEAPLTSVMVPRWRSVTDRPSGVRIVTVRPPPGTVPANVTLPAAGASTGSPADPPTSTPRC